jgi:hypothetical protein
MGRRPAGSRSLRRVGWGSGFVAVVVVAAVVAARIGEGEEGGVNKIIIKMP